MCSFFSRFLSIAYDLSLQPNITGNYILRFLKARCTKLVFSGVIVSRVQICSRHKTWISLPLLPNDKATPASIITEQNQRNDCCYDSQNMSDIQCTLGSENVVYQSHFLMMFIILVLKTLQSRLCWTIPKFPFLSLFVLNLFSHPFFCWSFSFIFFFCLFSCLL